MSASAPRIVGGQEVSPAGKYSFIASIQDTTGFHFCGGSIIARRFILTAAHCLVGESPSGVRVVVGRHKLSSTSGTTLRCVRGFGVGSGVVRSF